MAGLDGFDRSLLACLQENGRLTNQELGQRIGLSASQCSRRRIGLERAGYILGYRAEVSADALGLGLLVIVLVTLNAHSGDNARRFRDLVLRIDAVQEAYALTGDADYQLKARVADLRELSHLVNEVLLPHESVARVRSSIVLDRLKETARVRLR